MLTSHALLAPTLPTLLLDQHRGHSTEMLAALAEASARLLAEEPAAIVIVSARWESAGPFLVDPGKRHRTITDYSGFGVEVRYDCGGIPALARALIEAGEKARVPVAAATRGVDSGVSIPLRFLVPARGIPVVPLSIAKRTPEECRAWGGVVRRVLEEWPERVVFVTSGLLSRNEHAWTLSREVPETRILDDLVLNALGRGAWNEVAALDAPLAERAQPEAGLRHLELLRGFLLDDIAGELRCYEPGPGVGSVLVEFPLGERVPAAPVEA